MGVIERIAALAAAVTRARNALIGLPLTSPIAFAAPVYLASLIG